MRVTLTYQNTRLQRITFVGWQENRSRMARIDLDIVKGLGSCSVRPDPGGDNFRPELSAKVFETVRGNPFTEAEEEKIKKVLAGYCIEPDVKHIAHSTENTNV